MSSNRLSYGQYRRIADALHQLLCTASTHEAEDGCSWYFFSWEMPDDQRRLYLRKARALLKVLDGDVDLALKVIQAISHK